MSKLSKGQLYRLFQLAQQLLAGELQLAGGGERLQPFQGVFGITAVCLFDASTTGFHSVGSTSAELENQAREAYVTDQDLDDPAAGVTIRRLTPGGQITAAIAFKGLEYPELTAGPLASLAAALHESSRLLDQAKEAAVTAEVEAFRSDTLRVLCDEFKNALTTILAAAGGLREAGPLGAEQSEMARVVEQEASRLGNVISRLDRMARLDRGEVRPRTDTINLAALVAQAVEQRLQIAPERRIVFDGSGKSFKAVADAELIGLALSQLFESVGQCSGPGSAIRVGIEARGGSVVVTVAGR